MLEQYYKKDFVTALQDLFPEIVFDTSKFTQTCKLAENERVKVTKYEKAKNK